MQDMLCIGEIINTHGINGELKVVPLTDNFEDLFDYKHAFIDNEIYEIESVRFHKSFALIRLKDISDLDLAERFKGKFLELPRNELKPLPEGRYYICDLIGLKVIDEELGEVGAVKEVLETGSNDVYVVEYNGKPLCIPVLADVIKKIDLKSGVIDVKIPEGLI